MSDKYDPCPAIVRGIILGVLFTVFGYVCHLTVWEKDPVDWCKANHGTVVVHPMDWECVFK